MPPPVLVKFLSQEFEFDLLFLVIFETNEHSWHGFPRVDLSEEKRSLSRRSFALYYYTDSRPEDEVGPEHSTIYVDQRLPDDFKMGLVLDDNSSAVKQYLIATPGLTVD